MSKIVVIFFLVFLIDLTKAAPDKFNEELFIKPLHSGHVNTYFQFTTEWLLQNNESCKKQ